MESVVGGVSREGHDENRSIMMEGIHRALKENGKLLFAENLVSSPLHVYFREKFVKWGSNNWNYCTIQDMTEAMDVFNSIEFQTTGFSGTFGRSEFQRNVLARVDKMILNSIVPKKWHYIIYGKATKS